MKTSNLLLIPGTGEVATEVFRALRYEKTVRLYASTHGISNEDIKPIPHRMIPVSPLPEITESNFGEALTKTLEKANIEFIVPTDDAARAFFEDHSEFSSLLTTRFKACPPPFVQGADLMLDCYSDGDNKLVFAAARKLSTQKRKLPDIWHDIEVSEKQIEQATILSKYHSFHGPWSLALSRKDEPLGIQPYFMPETAIHRALGVNLMLLALHDARGNSISALPVAASARMAAGSKSISLKLDYKNVFIDLDDTLILHGSLNDTMMAFIHHCRVNKKPVHLITRHYRDPRITLREFAISETLFDNIFWIQDQTPKSLYMAKMSKPLLIDDAFSERSEVAQNTNIPSLPPDAVVALLVTL